MTLKIQRIRPSAVQLDALALHLFHPRHRSALQSQPSYAANVALLEQYRALPEPTLLRLFEIQKQMAGNPNKYSPQRLDAVDTVVKVGAVGGSV